MAEIKRVTFDPVIHRTGRNGDNWCMTWADDDCIYTSCDDGYGWDYLASIEYNNRVWRLQGEPLDFHVSYLPNFPLYTVRDEWYGYGLISVDGTLYHFITCASDNQFGFPFRGSKLICSHDHGKSWCLPSGESIIGRERDKNDMFFWYEGEDYAFANIEFLQCGRDNSLAKDEYIYLYAPNGRYQYHELNCARVQRDKIIRRDAYEYFQSFTPDGGAVWSKELEKRGAIHTFPENYGWYSWLPSVVYNPGLDLYIMANGGTGVNGSGMHDLPASLGIYYAKNPWGPWTEVYYTDNWVADNPENRLYQPKLCPKWISKDGREMYLIFSDASDSWGYQYRWNQQKIIFELA